MHFSVTSNQHFFQTIETFAKLRKYVTSLVYDGLAQKGDLKKKQN